MIMLFGHVHKQPFYLDGIANLKQPADNLRPEAEKIFHYQGGLAIADFSRSAPPVHHGRLFTDVVPLDVALRGREADSGAAKSSFEVWCREEPNGVLASLYGPFGRDSCLDPDRDGGEGASNSRRKSHERGGSLASERRF